MPSLHSQPEPAARFAFAAAVSSSWARRSSSHNTAQDITSGPARPPLNVPIPFQIALPQTKKEIKINQSSPSSPRAPRTDRQIVRFCTVVHRLRPSRLWQPPPVDAPTPATTPACGRSSIQRTGESRPSPRLADIEVNKVCGARARSCLTMDGTNDENRSSKLHTRLRLWEFPNSYIFEPIDGLADLYLSVSRATGTMNLVEELPPRGSSTNPKVQTVYGVIGVLKLAVGSYFLVITDRDCVGSHLGHAVFKVTGLKVLPCNNALSTSSAEQKKMEKEFSELLDAAERTIGLHFSYDINLTLTAQKLHDLGDEFKSLPLWRQVYFLLHF
ncbi:hypothetical protein EJB05_21292, partial [Eragrostis curvula]